MKIKVTFKEHLLGTLAGKKDVATDFIASKCKAGLQPDEVEVIQNIDENLTNGSTIFPRDEKGPFIWDYQWKGFFKEATESVFVRSGEFTKEQLKKDDLTLYMYKKTIDKQLFIKPRKIYLTLPTGCEMTFVERPLRGQTMQGERICLARSEAAPAGTTCVFEIVWFKACLKNVVERCLEYGQYSGMLQWRNSGAGSFTWEDVTPKVIG